MVFRASRLRRRGNWAEEGMRRADGLPAELDDGNIIILSFAAMNLPDA
jgi:hypothetical protein